MVVGGGGGVGGGGRGVISGLHKWSSVHPSTSMGFNHGHSALCRVVASEPLNDVLRLQRVRCCAAQLHEHLQRAGYNKPAALNFLCVTGSCIILCHSLIGGNKASIEEQLKDRQLQHHTLIAHCETGRYCQTWSTSVAANVDSCAPHIHTSQTASQITSRAASRAALRTASRNRIARCIACCIALDCLHAHRCSG